MASRIERTSFVASGIETTAIATSVAFETFLDPYTVSEGAEIFVGSSEAVETISFLETDTFSTSILSYYLATESPFPTSTEPPSTLDTSEPTTVTTIPKTASTEPSSTLPLTSTGFSSTRDPLDRASSVTSTPSLTIPTVNSPSTPRPTPNNLIAPGAAAGIGVGSAAAGAFIAALIVWFIMRKARKSPQIPNDDPGGSWLSTKTA